MLKAGAAGSPPGYASLLAAAETIRVTADSVAMVSDSIWTGRPLALVPVKASTLGRTAMAPSDGIGRRLYPHDLRKFWRTLADIGISTQLSLPGTLRERESSKIMERVRPILDQCRQGGGPLRGT